MKSFFPSNIYKVYEDFVADCFVLMIKISLRGSRYNEALTKRRNLGSGKEEEKKTIVFFEIFCRLFQAGINVTSGQRYALLTRIYLFSEKIMHPWAFDPARVEYNPWF